MAKKGVDFDTTTITNDPAKTKQLDRIYSGSSIVHASHHAPA